MPSSTLPNIDVDQALRDRRLASDYICDALRTAILDGQLEEGEELNQVALAAHFNVSRVPVREALSRLQAEGLVSAAAHRRVVVIGVSPPRVTEIFELRKLLEVYLLENAFPHHDSASVRRLEELCSMMDAASDHDSWLELNRAFHNQLYLPADDKTTVDILRSLTMRVERFVRESGSIDRVKQAGAEHRRIVRALKRGDIETARRELRRHIGQTQAGVARKLGDPARSGQR